MSNFNSLYRLIKSLSRNEKGYIRKAVSGYRKNNHLIKLLTDINGLKTEDEASLRKKYTRTHSVVRYHGMKQNLYALILKALRNFHAEFSAETKIRNGLNNIQILFEKGLTEECGKELNRTLAIANHYEKPLAVYELITWEEKIMQKAMDPDLTRMFLSERTKILKNISEEISVSTQLREFYNRVALFYERFGKLVRTPENEKELDGIMDHPFLKQDFNSRNPSTRSIYHIMMGFYLSMKGSLEESIYYYGKSMADMEENPALILEKPHRYWTILNNLIWKNVDIGKYNEALSLFPKLKSIPLRGPATVINRVGALNQELSINNSLYEITRANTILTEIEAILPDAQGIIDNNLELTLFYNIASHYLIQEKYKDALKWFRKSLDVSRGRFRQDLYINGMVWCMIIHFELGNSELIESLARSLYRYLLKNKMIFEMETVFLHFIRYSLPKTINPSNRILVFIKLQQDLKDIREKLSETAPLLSVWLESKIANRSFKELVKIHIEETTQQGRLLSGNPQ